MGGTWQGGLRDGSVMGFDTFGYGGGEARRGRRREGTRVSFGFGLNQGRGSECYFMQCDES